MRRNNITDDRPLVDFLETNIKFEAVFWKRSVLESLPLPRFRFRFHQNVLILLVAIPPTYLEAADKTNRLRFRFQNPVCQMLLLYFE